MTGREDEHKGFSPGGMKSTSDGFSVSVEYDHLSDRGLSVGLNYHFQWTRPGA